ncbi:uncharacterized protein BDR25DRAFT_307430 [Lindgomyces ingoldianus]|uniref:Uncharacterized protein n=1 Tax=Lindgomyces ingoldianus TaxID=673940 RepID=A0ACB6QD00_9PLEO|nr:uncharacterized protein BDR25DRAFT_307430 [Lindgomyces ingoldianus]KAF2464015.1 hypothetical protein BDR25DRAFT_307430 [Lindgomyces ingoldianus]
MHEGGNLKAVSASDNTARTHTLRNSCEPCHVSKLRCSREKPVCARCAKNGMNCSYAPTKRPGRPRKVPPAAPTAANVTQGAVGQEDAGASSDTRHQSRREVLDTAVSGLVDAQHDLRPGPGPGALDLITTSSSSQDLNTAECIDASVAAVMDSVGPDPCTDVFDFMNAHMLDDADLFVDPLAKLLDSATSARHDYGDPSMAVPASSSQSQNIDQSPCLDPAFWPTEPARFADDCISLQHWVAASPVLGPFMDASEQGTATGHDCFCHTAAANLLFHRKSAKSVQPNSALDACLHLQRVLDWTWGILKDCHSCLDDELIQFIVAGTAKEVVTIYRTIIDDMTRRSRTGGNRGNKSTTSAHGGERRGNGRQGQHGLLGQQSGPTKVPQVPTTTQTQTQMQNSSLFGSTVLSFGHKAIHGSVKIAFLRRLVSLKLRQLGCLLKELLSWTQAEATSGPVGSPLKIHVTGILERINITAGMLSTLE